MRFFPITLFCFLIFFLSCTNDSNTSNSKYDEVWQLERQEVMAFDTTFAKGGVEKLNAQIIAIDTVIIPLGRNLQEFWRFTDSTLQIATTTSAGQEQVIDYQLVKRSDGFQFNRPNEQQFCKVIEKNETKMVLESNGRIVLKRVK